MTRAAQPQNRPKLIDGLRTGALWIGGALAILGGLTLLAGPVGFRAGWFDYEAATRGVQAWAMLWFAIALALALLALIASLAQRRQRGSIVAVVLMLASGYGLGQLYGQSEIRRNVPPIWDLQTSWDRPVAFRRSTLEERVAAKAVDVRDDAMLATSGSQWAGLTFAEAQASYYDLKPLHVSAPVDVATSAAADAAKRLGWTVTASDPPAGVMEAMHREFWYGLTADVAVRVTAEGEGSRIDVRSTSRTAGGDMGANAVRISALLNEVNFALARR